MLTGEIADEDVTLVARARELTLQLGLEPAADAAVGLSPTELALVVTRTLMLPEIASVGTRLVPELSVLAAKEIDGLEVATVGVVDAVCLGDCGRPELVIDRESDVDPNPAIAEQYRSQVKRYPDVMGTPPAQLSSLRRARLSR